MTREQAAAACERRETVTWASRGGPVAVRVIALLAGRASIVTLDEYGRRYFVPLERLQMDPEANETA